MKVATTSLLFLIACCVAATAQTKPKTIESRVQTPNFDYQIVENTAYVDPGIGQLVRTIYIHIQPSSFSEINLRRLFEMVAKQFAQPRFLYVAVETNRKYLPPPSGDDIDSGRSAVSNDPDRYKFHRAYYLRTAHMEVFLYNPTLGTPKRKVVGLKGKAPSEN